MAKDPFDEILQFLKPDCRIDLKHLSLEHLLDITGTASGKEALLKNEEVVRTIIDLTDDCEIISKTALLILVNITSDAHGATELLKYRPHNKTNVVELFLGYVLDPKKSHADAACMILSNITRVENSVKVCLDTFIPHLEDLLKVLSNLNYNQCKSKLNYIAPLFSNLSCSARFRKWLTEPSMKQYPFIPLKKLIPFCNYVDSVIRRGGAVGTVRNLSFDTSYHEFLLSEDLDLLTYILPPIMGGEEYDDEEMEKLPVACQYYPTEKVRDNDEDIRRMIIETLNKLCAKKHGRETLRNNGVYYVLREYHKWEKNPAVLLACENVIDILIQKEDEVGAEDLSSVQVPEDMEEKFRKMDEDFLNSAP
ncbi:protein HGH1 homolog [Bicyclus anynana]|uniref:Protein HGH1 homolog n=1 Tax=Bicyclus anynana TaxID=110368 RepID=A0A6J1NF30_BICAN|nr:protein HGH1 homolog [Bicyclus anynana]